MKDNNVSSFALFQSSEPDYADMKFNSHSDIEHILNESAFTFPSSVLSSIDLQNLNFPIFDDESYVSSCVYLLPVFLNSGVTGHNWWGLEQGI